MSSATDNLSPSVAPSTLPHAEQRFVDDKIRRTRRALKTVDLVAGLITLAIGVLSYLLTMAVLEHWIVQGGLSSAVRTLLLLILLVGVGWYCWRYFWPLLSRPINPVYAAKTIEQSSPSLKNSLLNLLLLRDRRRQISRQVYQAIEQQAAQRLSEVPVDTTVDRSVILRLGYVLVAVVALCMLYRILSPKDPIASAGRLLMPWSDIPVPSRVQILDVQPGDTSVARGEQVTISAEIHGRREDEPVRVVYSQTDGQVVDQEIIMTGDETSLLYKCRLPGRIAVGSGGIQNDVTYRIEAGDARSPEFKISVFSQPTLVVERIRYDYPSYTDYPDREEEFTGDISAVEGTVVTLYAIANQEIEKAHVDFGADGRHDLLMNSEGTKASVQFPLELEEDRRTPTHTSYVLRYTTAEGRRNPSPPKYKIEVQRDYSPEIELLEPREEVLDVRLNDEVALKLEARDPDFALHNVAVLGAVSGERVLKEALLSKDHTGRFEGQLKIVPAELHLQEGDVLEYWGAAADNRRPRPNISFTSHQKLRIVGEEPREPLPDGEQQQESGEGQQGESGDQGGEGQQNEGQQGNSGGTGSQDQQGESQGDQQGAEGEGQQGEGSGSSQQQEGNAGGSSESQGESAGESDGTSAGQSRSDGQQDSEQQGESQSSEAGSDGQNSEGQSGVSPDGDNDGEAFERIAEHFNQKDQSESSNQQGESQSGTEQQPGESTQSQETGENGTQSQSDNQQVDGQQSKQGQQSQQDEQGAAGASQEDQRQADGQQGEGQQGLDSQSEGSEQGAQEQGEQESANGDSAEGEGAEGHGDQQQQSDQRKKSGDQQQGDSPSGEMNKEQGSEGAGESPNENQGTPNPEGAQKPSDKQQGESDDSQLQEQEAPSDSRSQKESDSQGGQGGDRSGGGQEGAGQQADEQGTGAAGEHQSAEDGAGESPEQGEGETGEQAGDQTQADGKTGQSSGDQQGEGSQQGEQSGEQPGGEQSGADGPSGQPSENPAESSEGSGTPEGGGTGSNNGSPPPSSGDPLPGDEANLDYARKQTDLVLNRLEDQLKKKQVDEELLDKLGWSPEDLQRFVDRWKNLKDKATGTGPDAEAAKQELDISLQSLGLNKDRPRGFQSRTVKDKLRDLQESFQGRTPLEYEELMRKYVKGISSAEEE